MNTTINPSRLRRDVADLLTCSISDVTGIYDKALDLFERHTAPGWMGSFRAAEIDGKPHYDALRQRAPGWCGKTLTNLQQFDGAPIMRGPTMDIGAPELSDINQFRVVDMRGPELEGSELHTHFLVPYEIHSCFRIMTYRGPRFTGWIGTFRGRDEPVFDANFVRQFRQFSEPLKVVFSAAEQLSKRGLWEDEKFAIFDARGRLDFASPDLRSNCNSHRMGAIGDIVRKFDRGDIDQCVRVVDGVEVRISRLAGRGMFCYLAQFVPAQPVISDPLTRLTLLTPAQREVASLAARGRTNSEIAAKTNRSVNTVKVHLRNIYKRLDISTRLELAMLLD